MRARFLCIGIKTAEGTYSTEFQASDRTGLFKALASNGVNSVADTNAVREASRNLLGTDLGEIGNGRQQVVEDGDDDMPVVSPHVPWWIVLRIFRLRRLLLFMILPAAWSLGSVIAQL